MGHEAVHRLHRQHRGGARGQQLRRWLLRAFRRDVQPVIEAIRRQLDDLVYSPRRYTNRPAIALARRLVERGVRFVQCFSGSGSAWDAHEDLEANHSRRCRETDRPIAGLLTDLKARGLLDELKAAKGSVVNVTSIAGSRVHPFAGAAYSTSKAALAALTREMAADFGPLGIRVNAIAPGEIDTAILSPGTEAIIPQIPLHRLGTTDEVAKIIYVLCTETSSYLNGAEIHINGGQHV